MGSVKEQSKRREDLLALLQDEQGRSGCLSAAFIAEVAQALGLPISEVYGVATFYSFLSTTPQGRNIIRICDCVPCWLKGASGVVETMKKALGISPGETTADGRFSLELTNCIGACDKSPAMLVNNDVHGNLTAEKITEILGTYR
jgi:NADH-quinone oxidoreductase subunit E